jgi:hypothetical protein
MQLETGLRKSLSLPALKRLAKALGVPVTALLDDRSGRRKPYAPKASTSTISVPAVQRSAAGPAAPVFQLARR